MKNDIISFILYPIKDSQINDRKLYQIFDEMEEFFPGLTIEEVIEALNIEISEEDLSEISKNIKIEDKVKYFNIAHEISKLIDISKTELEKLAVLGKILNLKINETNVNINIYEKEDLNEFEFQKTVRNFSLVAGAVGFVPFVPISDFALLTVMQTGMITKIANIYGYKMEPKEFLKMLSGVLGTGFVFRTLTQILRKFIPFVGWVLNASVAYSGTYAIGILTKAYIAESGDISKDAIFSIWERSVEEGKKEFFSLKDYLSEKKVELLKEMEKYKKANDVDVDTEKEEEQPKQSKKSKK